MSLRPKVIAPINERAAGLTSDVQAFETNRLRSVDARTVLSDAAELWIGVHVSAPESQASLERLARRAGQFTPRVSLVAPDGLLLEVKGSLHLFNGTEGLIHALTHECTNLGIESAIALAPTPLAAMVAARAGKPFVVRKQAQLIGQLASLPLTPLRWPQDVVERLARMGVRTIGQALRLPRAGFARRFGPAQLAELDRLTGWSADPRNHFQPRERFRRRRELTYEMENNETLLAALTPLLVDLGRFLQERQCGITMLECRLGHRHAPPSRCTLRLASPMADVARLSGLLGERLNALTLPEPVRSCELRTGIPVLRVLASSPLWQPGEHGGGGGAEAPELIERLRVRLGHEAVYGLQVLPGHRPERVWRTSEPTAAQCTATPTPARRSALVCAKRADAPTAADDVKSAEAASSVATAAPWPAFRRPTWLLRMPQQLQDVDGLPRRRGSLRFFGDVERIETGWWDGGEAERDYYTVRDIYGVRLWIFRERTEPHRWFLHGVFG